MKTRDTKRRPIRTIPPPGPEDGDEALVTYLHKYPAEELEKAGYLQEPTPEEIRDLEESVEHDIKRQKAKGLAKEYPKANYDRSSLADQLKCVPGLKHSDRKAMAQSLKVIADRASDMEEIMQRILKEKHSPAEIAELLLAFNEMINYVRSYGQNLSPKICDVFDRLKGLVPTNQIAQHRNRTKPTRNGV